MEEKIKQKIIDWMGVLTIPGIGPSTFWKILSASKELPKVDGLDEVYERHISQGISIIAEFENRYPKNLKKLHDVPPIIYAKGDVSILSDPLVAIVGARNASISSKKWTENLAKELIQNGFGVVSGLARGIDSSAHIGGIERTCAVVAGGIDQIYPKENTMLYKTIEKQGCIISEDPIGVQPSAPLFPRRNRLIAALSSAVIVVEAAIKSGSLITCKNAMEIGVDVFSVPGAPYDTKCEGNLLLLKDGAYLCRGIDDIIEVIGKRSALNISKNHESQDGVFISEDKSITSKEIIIGLIGSNPVPLFEVLDQVSDRSKALEFISELEIEGVIKRLIDGRILKI